MGIFGFLTGKKTNNTAKLNKLIARLGDGTKSKSDEDYYGLIEDERIINELEQIGDPSAISALESKEKAIGILLDTISTSVKLAPMLAAIPGELEKSKRLYQYAFKLRENIKRVIGVLEEKANERNMRNMQLQQPNKSMNTTKDEIQNNLNIVNNAYLVRDNPGLEKQVRDALTSILSTGEKGISILLDRLYEGVSISGRSIHLKNWGDMTWNEFLIKREIILALQNGHVKSASARLEVLLNADCRVGQWPEIVVPALRSALETIGSSSNAEQPMQSQKELTTVAVTPGSVLEKPTEPPAQPAAAPSPLTVPGVADRSPFEAPQFQGQKKPKKAGKRNPLWLIGTIGAILFVGTCILLGIVWKLNQPEPPAAWTLLNPNTEPPARAYGGIAYDTRAKQAIMFGGVDASGPTNETWAWDGKDWKKLTPANQPSPRDTFSMAYDEIRNRIVLFGGENGNTYYDDTWEWDGTNWQLINPAHKPSPRGEYGLTYDSQRKTILLFGGYTGNSSDLFSNEVWAWDGNDWTDITCCNLTGTGGAVLVDYPTHKEVILISPLDWANSMAWDESKWLDLGTNLFPATVSGAGVYNPKADKVVYFGGWTGDGDRMAVSSNTWIFDGTGWTLLDLPVHPSGRAGNMMFYDPKLQAAILFGGYDYEASRYYEDTWEFSLPRKGSSSGITPLPSITRTLTPAYTLTSTPIPPTATPQPTATPRVYILPPGTFPLDTNSSCSTDASITEVDANGFMVGGTISMVNGAWVLWCPGAKHTWEGTLSYMGYTFSSDAVDPLQFLVTMQGGYQYLGGKGKVTQPDGQVISFP